MYCYGLCDGNAAEARRIYQRRFPNRRLPHVSVFASSTYRRLSETCSVQRSRQLDTGHSRRYTAEDEELIHQLFIDDLNISTNMVARELGMSQWNVWSVVHLSGQHPYHYQLVQSLEDVDPSTRLEFCRFMLSADAENRVFLKNMSHVLTVMV